MTFRLFSLITIFVVVLSCYSCLPAVDRYDVEVMTIVNQSQEILRCEVLMLNERNNKQVIVSQGQQDTLKTAYHIQRPVRFIFDLGTPDIDRHYVYYIKDTVELYFEGIWRLIKDSVDLHDVRWRKIVITDDMIAEAERINPSI